MGLATGTRQAKRLGIDSGVGIEDPARVLVVDDEPVIRELVAEALELEGYAVETAANGAEALTKVQARAPSVIVLDLMMPVMNGWDFLNACRAYPACAGVPVVVTSAYRRLPETAASLGVTACVAKPFDLRVLLGAIERLIR